MTVVLKFSSFKLGAVCSDPDYTTFRHPGTRAGTPGFLRDVSSRKSKNGVFTYAKLQVLRFRNIKVKKRFALRAPATAIGIEGSPLTAQRNYPRLEIHQIHLILSFALRIFIVRLPAFGRKLYACTRHSCLEFAVGSGDARPLKKVLQYSQVHESLSELGAVKDSQRGQ